jgi:hypothetical protein
MQGRAAVALLHSVGEHAEPSYSFLLVAAATCGYLIDILLDEADKAAGSPVTGAETLTRSRPDTAREAHALPSCITVKSGSRACMPTVEPARWKSPRNLTESTAIAKTSRDVPYSPVDPAITAHVPQLPGVSMASGGPLSPASPTLWQRST